MNLRSTLLTLAFTILSLQIGAQVRVEAEKLEIVRITAGGHEEQEMLDFAPAGTFGGDRIIHWLGQENPGDLIEFKVPVSKPGKYRLTLGIVKSWDYGIFQPMVDGKDVGRPLDLFSGGPEESSVAAKVEIGTIEVKREHFLLAMRYTGSNPESKSDPNPGSMGLDWVMLTPVAEAGSSTGSATTPSGQSGATGVSAGSGTRIEAEKLEIVRVTAGGHEDQEMLDFAPAGTFGNDRIVHWMGQEKPGDLIEFKVPVAKPGTYRLTLGIVKSWDYGIFQPMVDGKDVGRPLDLYSGGPEEKSVAAKVEIGTIEVKREHVLLAMRYTGSNPESKSDPNPGSMGLDWVMFTPVGGSGTGDVGSTTPMAGPVGAWYDKSTGVLLVISGNGTWTMAHPDRTTTPRAGNWSQQGGTVTLRCHPAGVTQLWNGQIGSAAAQKLVTGPYDLSMVWTLQMQGGTLSGTLRAGTPKIGDGGALAGFVTYSDPRSTPIKVSFVPVPRSAPPAELRPTIEKLRTTERGQVGSALKDWVTDFYREGDLFGNERGQ